jgi:hypothetical protein
MSNLIQEPDAGRIAIINLYLDVKVRSNEEVIIIEQM